MMLRAILVMAGAFVVAAIALAPMRTAWAVVGAPAGVSVERIGGTIWSGELIGVSWRGVGLGDFRSSLSLLTRPGNIVLHLVSGEGPVKAATLSTSGGGALENVFAAFNLADLVPSIAGEARTMLRDGYASFDGAACRNAGGRVTVAAIPQYGLPELNGDLSCARGDLVASLASADGVYSVSAVIGPEGARILAASPTAALLLPALGVSAPEARQ